MTDSLQPIDQIPEFKNLEEEAAFWDTHDVADLLEKGERVQVRFAPKQRSVSVRFDDAAVAQLRVQANKRGLKPTTLIRMWVMERLNQVPPQQNRLSHSG